MGKLVVTTNVSLDGVVQDPDGQEGFERGGWFAEFAGDDRDAWAEFFTDEALHADALLLGRRSDDWFARRWSDRSGVWADRLNELPKYVVSSTAAQPQWRNGTILDGDAVAEVARLKGEFGGKIVVYGSYQLVHTLLEHGLVDELRLIVLPVVLGAGERLFGATSDAKALRLKASTTVGNGIALLAYEVVGA